LDFIKGLDLFQLDTLFHNLTEKYQSQIEIDAEIPIVNSFKKFRERNSSASLTPAGSVICGPGFRTCGLTPDGRVLTCSYIQRNGWTSESVRENKFLDIWKNSHIFEPFRKLVFSDLYQCQSCPLLMECRGGCRAVAVNANGDFFSKDPLCILDRTKAREEKGVSSLYKI
jgi:radical SAM protein with 4Fe4S-binding SPASM domain